VSFLEEEGEGKTTKVQLASLYGKKWSVWFSGKSRRVQVKENLLFL